MISSFKTDETTRVFLIILFMSYPLFSIFWYKGYFITITLFVAATAILDIFSSRGSIWFSKKPIATYVFFSLPLVTLTWSNYPGETVWRGAMAIANLGIFYLLLRSNVKDDKRSISELSTLIPIVTAILFIIIHLKYDSIRPNSKEMKEFVGSISNVGAAMALPCLPYLLIPPLLKNRVARTTGFIACIAVISLSQSRGAIILLLTTPIILLLFLPAKPLYRSIKIIKYLLIITLISYFTYAQFESHPLISSITERIKNTQMTDILKNSTPIKEKGDYGRAIIVAEGINTIKTHPISGVGYGGLYKIIEENHGRGRISHNIIITAWGEMGILGMISLLWVFFTFYFHLNKCKNNKFAELEDRMLACATLASITIILLHAQLRPIYSNPIVPIIFAQAYSVITRARNN